MTSKEKESVGLKDRAVGTSSILWGLAFLVCWGLGYPTLNRYDPRHLAGTIDAAEYADLVEAPAWQSAHLSASELRPRVLVPYVAKPFYWLAKGRVGSWQPVLFGLLVANSMLCATTSVLLVNLATRVVGDCAIALLSMTLYVLNFAVSNLYLSGYVDSGESCLLMAVTWAMSTQRWRLLPIFGVLGGLAKETFVPLAGIFSLTWWLAVAPGHRDWRISLVCILAMDAIGLAVVLILWSTWWAVLVWPWDIVVSHYKADTSFLTGLSRCVFSHELWLVFGWLLPLGAWGLGRLPRPWVFASFVTAVFALALSAWDNGAGNAARPMFTVAGPVLSLSVALFLARDKPACEQK
jgi:hypothetical protein